MMAAAIARRVLAAGRLSHAGCGGAAQQRRGSPAAAPRRAACASRGALLRCAAHSPAPPPHDKGCGSEWLDLAAELEGVGEDQLEEWLKTRGGAAA